MDLNIISVVFVGANNFNLVYRIYYKRRDLSNRVYASMEAREEAIEKAEKLEAELEPEYPSFVKPMLQSHVTGGFWLVSPFFTINFCSFLVYSKNLVC